MKSPFAFSRKNKNQKHRTSRTPWHYRPTLTFTGGIFV
jgi:hypothetical protein